MFFKLLKLAGLDINAKIAELKADLAFKAEQASEQVTRKARAICTEPTNLPSQPLKPWSIRCLA